MLTIPNVMMTENPTEKGFRSDFGASTTTTVEKEYPPAHALAVLTQHDLERILGVQVSMFPGRYVEAFTHKSAARELRAPSLERLEFLGDSVISFVVAKYLFDVYPDQDEGFLTRIRTKLTCSATLASLARVLGLSQFVIMNGCSMAAKWYANERVLEDVFEALVGALYLDRGLTVAKTFFLGLVEKYVDKRDLLENNNYKDILMRWTQTKGETLPSYVSHRVTSHQGYLVYDTTVSAGTKVGRGVDANKKRSEMRAAKMLLLELGLTR
jgi:ribonuclease-3